MHVANVEQGITYAVQDYMQRIVHLVESTYIWVYGRSQVVMKQVLGFFIESLRDQDIKMVMMKDESQTLEALIRKPYLS